MTLPVEVPEGIVLPQPKGYKILIAIPKRDEKIGNILTPTQWQKAEETASIYGMVISVGDTAYLDPDKFPTGPWCQPGDWVIFRSYSGTRLKVEGVEYRLINDDTVEAVVDDPRKIERAG
jgi:co-chaperonin GroES (HSP10)